MRAVLGDRISTTSSGGSVNFAPPIWSPEPGFLGIAAIIPEDGHDHVPLKLLESRPHRNGVVALRYARAA